MPTKTTPSPSALRTYITEAGKLPDDALLGHLAWFSVFDATYSLAQVTSIIEAGGLDPTFTPLPVEPVDAYRRATSETTGATYNLTRGKARVSASLLVRELASDAHTITRALVREIRDESNKRLAYDTVATLTFYRASVRGGLKVAGSERINVHLDAGAYSTDEQAPLREAAAAILERYDTYRAHIDGQRLRRWLRAYLAHLNAVAIRAGLYFVHVSRAGELEALAAATRGIGMAQSTSTTFHLAPLVDLESQREMVIASFQAEAAASLSEVIAEIARLRATRKTVTGAAYAKVKTQYDTVIARAREYTRTLNTSLDSVGATAEGALTMLMALQADIATQELAA